MTIEILKEGNRMKKDKLNPCLCGAVPKIAMYDWGYSVKEYWIYCTCGFETRKFHSKDKLTEVWNRRK